MTRSNAPRQLAVTVLLLAVVGLSSPAAASTPAPYALPWQLRPAGASTVLRLENSLAFSDVGTTNVTFLLGSYAFNQNFAAIARLGTVGHWPEVGESGAGIVNGAVGGMYARKFGDLRAAAYLLFAVPFGMGGGNSPDPATAAAVRAGPLARLAMDNAMFAVNDFTVFPGIDLAWVRGGFTVQAEATVLQLTRVRGELAQADDSKTNFTSGLFAGWFALPELSVGAELRYQRWLSTPAAVRADPDARDNLSLALGLRAHLKLTGSIVARPGVSYTRGLGGKVGDLGYDVVQLDLPVQF